MSNVAASFTVSSTTSYFLSSVRQLVISCLASRAICWLQPACCTPAWSSPFMPRMIPDAGLSARSLTAEYAWKSEFFLSAKSSSRVGKVATRALKSPLGRSLQVTIIRDRGFSPKPPISALGFDRICPARERKPTKNVTTRPPPHRSARRGPSGWQPGIVTAIGHGLEIAGDAAVGLGVLEGTEAAGDLLLDLAHAQVAFGAVVGEGHVGAAWRTAARPPRGA